jgi:hypothetical protein
MCIVFLYSAMESSESCFVAVRRFDKFAIVDFRLLFCVCLVGSLCWIDSICGLVVCDDAVGLTRRIFV